jgi:hypothetical protein
VTLARPRCLVLRIVQFCLPQPKMHSIIARHDCDMPWPSCRAVRPSMALRRRLPVAVAQSFCVEISFEAMIAPSPLIGDESESLNPFKLVEAGD